jgi:hypothetical protein
MREFLLFLFWVQELVAFCLAHIEPIHNGLGLGIPTISQRDRSFGVNPLTLAGNRKHGRHSRSIFAQDLDEVMTIVGVGQLEPVGSRG